jgi:hypothetical protein
VKEIVVYDHKGAALHLDEPLPQLLRPSIRCRGAVTLPRDRPILSQQEADRALDPLVPLRGIADVGPETAQRVPAVQAAAPLR